MDNEYNEMQGIAKAMGLEIGTVVAMNLVRNVHVDRPTPLFTFYAHHARANVMVM